VNLKSRQSSLDDYERVPIDAFGAALLRGMGWKEGNMVGKNQSGCVTCSSRFNHTILIHLIESLSLLFTSRGLICWDLVQRLLRQCQQSRKNISSLVKSENQM
jgi:hypothetical protein